MKLKLEFAKQEKIDKQLQRDKEKNERALMREEEK